MKKHPGALVSPPSRFALWRAGLLLVIITMPGAFAQEPPLPAAVRAAANRITTEQVKADLDFLASDALKGRNTPSPGFDTAADYIEKRLRRAGVKPVGDNGTYRQHYVMRESTLAPGTASITIGDRTFAAGDGFVPRPFAGELISAPVGAVYVGHGWTAEAIDPYSGIDITGKIVVVHGLNARPRGAKILGLGRVTVGGTSPLVEAARRGALAVVYLASGEPQGTGGGRGSAPMVRRELDAVVPSAYAAAPITALQLGAEATQALLAGTQLDPAALANQAKAQTFPASFELPTKISVRIPSASIVHRPFNVVGLVEGTDPVLKDQYIVVQSHLDGAVGSREVDGDSVYNSADDNATGSAANLSIAEQMVTARPKRSLIFVWDSGEEQGLWGTRQFVATPPVPLEKIVAMFNIDMIGANRAPGSRDAAEARVTGPNEVFLIGPGVLSDRANALIDRVNDGYLKLILNRTYDTPESEFFYPRTDAGPYLERGILTIGFTTGIHDRYHLPADEARFLDADKTTAIAKTIFAVAHALAQTAQRPAIEKPVPATVLKVR
jgi:Zn-dependent M28 family amino/carboxypeptidase